MLEMAALALLGGVFLGLNRFFISRLGMSIGPFRSSLWNHLGGFLFLLLLMLVSFPLARFGTLGTAPWWAYFGGAVGALFVALSSIVIPAIGSSRALALIVSGQMLASLVIDLLAGRIEAPLSTLLGAALILTGALLPRFVAIAAARS